MFTSEFKLFLGFGAVVFLLVVLVATVTDLKEAVTNQAVVVKLSPTATPVPTQVEVTPSVTLKRASSSTSSAR